MTAREIPLTPMKCHDAHGITMGGISVGAHGSVMIVP